MMRVLALLFFLPSFALAQGLSITNSGASGHWTNTAVWSGGIVPNSSTHSVHVSEPATIQIVSSLTLSNFTQTAGVVTNYGNFGITIGQTYTQTGGTNVRVGIVGYWNLKSPTNMVIEGGAVLTNLNILFSGSGSFDIAGLTTNTAQFSDLDIRAQNGSNCTLTMRDVTNSCIRELRAFENGGTIVTTNSHFSKPLLFSVGFATVQSTGLVERCTGTISYMQINSPNALIAIKDSNLHWALTASSGRLAVTNSTLSVISSANALLFPSDTELSDCTIRFVANCGTFTPPKASFAAAHVLGYSVGLGGGWTSVVLTNGGTISTKGFTVQAQELENGNIVVASNSTLIVSSFINTGTFTPQTSTLQYGLSTTSGVLSNVPSVYNLASTYPGKSISLLTPVTVSNVFSSAGAPNAPISWSGTVTLVNPATATFTMGTNLTVTGKPIQVYHGYIKSGALNVTRGNQ
jgi:hypothetical protein